MEEGKKSKSLIFQLYQKFKEAQEKAGAASAQRDVPAKADEEKIQAGATGSQTGESQPVVMGDQSGAGIPAGAENQSGADQGEGTEGEAKPIPEEHIEEIPNELKYLIPVYELYTCLSRDETALPAVGSIHEFEDRMFLFLKNDSVYTDYAKAVRHFSEELALVSSIRCSKVNSDKEAASTEGEEQEPEELPPLDAEVHIKIMDNKMSALIFVIPAQNEGKELDVGSAIDALNENHVVYGIDEVQLRKLLKDGLYMQMIVAARGTLPLPGTNGYIEDRTDCQKKKEMRQDEQGKVDFKNLDLYENVEKGQVICELIPATEGLPGSDICGKELPPSPVKTPALTCGKNTIIAENGMQLLAAVDGYVSFKGGHFNVEPVLEIKENVDYSVGNIDFSGNVIVNGDVSFGFTVRAQGNITVKGMVEGAELIAGGDIVLKKGMNGNHSGSLNAKGDVRATFLENCTVHVEGSLYADSIISCDIFCDEAIYLEGNRGIVIGGTVTVLRSLEARMIGSKSQRQTSIILGETPGLVTRKSDIKAELEEIRKILEKLKLNIGYLDKLRGTLPPDKLSILTQLNEQEALYVQKKTELEEKLLELIQASTDYSHCYIKCNMIFPITRIEIGNSSMSVNSVLSKCRLYLSEDEVMVGTY